MSTNPRRFILALGGYQKVAQRLGKSDSTVHGWLTAEDGRKKLGFVYPEGPVLPRPERDIVEAGKKRAASGAAKKPRKKPDDGDEPTPPPATPPQEAKGGGRPPRVPLKT